MVERNLPKVDVAGSSPVIRSKGSRRRAFFIINGFEVYNMKYTYIPRGVCSRMIELEIEDDAIKSCRFLGGCNGNLQGIGKLVQDMKVDEAIERLEGIDCAGRGTSCPDQLAHALRAAQEA